MNRDDVIRWAREAELINEFDATTPWIEDHDLTPYLERFAALAYAAGVEAEREASAQFLESTHLGSLPDDTALHYARLLKGFAEGIRARKENT